MIEGDAGFPSDTPLGYERAYVVDVTAVSGQTMYTGVQRVVREFVEANEEELLLVKFDPRDEVFRIIPHLRKLRYRSTEGFWSHVRLFLKGFYWSASKEFREEGARRSWLPKPIRNAARWVYDAILSDTYIEERERLRKRPVWQPYSEQTFVLLDIPVNLKHTEALNELSNDREIRFVVFLHDLFPLSHKPLFNPKHHPGVRARHLRYLDIVGNADEVVTNSDFTRSQYARFTELLEDARGQLVRTVYLPWPDFADDVRRSGVSQFGDAAVRVLTVGGLNQRKNIVVLVRALRIMLARGDSVVLVIAAGQSDVNDPNLRAEMLDLTDAERERIVIVGALPNDELVALYDSSNVVAVPSLAEGFGLPVVEGLSRGRAVVASATTAMVELGAILPVTLVPPSDASAWASALTAASTGEIVHVDPPAQFPMNWKDFRMRLLPARSAPIETPTQNPQSRVDAPR